MKIIYIHTDFLDAPTPASTFLINRAMSLVENNATVILIARIQNETNKHNILKEKFAIEHCPKNFKIILSDQEVNHLYEQCKKVCLLEKPDILYTRSLKMLPKLLSLKKDHKNIKVFFESHDFYMSIFQRNDIKKIKNLKNFIREKIYLPKIDGLVCVNTAQSNLYKQHLSIPILALSSGILAHDDVKTTIIENTKTLAYIGALDPRKKIPEMIQLMTFLPEEYKLIIFGGKNDEEILWINNLIEQNSLKNKVYITGWLTRQEMHKKLENVSLGLIPLEESFFNKYLTYPLKLSDYYKFNIPVLTNRFPSAKDYLIENETGFFVDWDNFDETKKIILNILEHDKLYATLRIKVENFKKLNSISENGKKLLSFFNNQQKG